MRLEGQKLSKTFLSYVIPSVAAQWVYALYTMIDGIFVSRGVSEMALSAVNISMPFVTLLFALSLMLAVGTSTVIAISFGRKEYEKANRVFSQSIVVMLVISALVAAGVLLNLERIALFLGAGPQTLGYVKSYVGTIASFSVCFMAVYLFEILIKADGHPRLATLFVCTGAVLNCILDYVFVFVIRWGVFGAAFATGLSQLAVVLLYVGYFLTGRSQLKFKKFRFDCKALGHTLTLGLSSGITEFSSGICIFFFNHAILRYIGEEALVSYTIVAYVSTIVIMSMAGISQGMQPLVSYYYGQGQMERCKKLLRYGLIAAAVVSVAIFVPTWLGAGGIVALFISADLTQLRAYSTEVFRIFSTSFLLVGFNVILSGYLTALERKKSAMAISLGRGILFLLLSLFVLTALFGGDGIWWSATLSEGLCLVLTGVLLVNYQKSFRRRAAGKALSP